MVGGSTARHRFTPARATALGQRVAELARRAGGALMVTTSRRTDAAAKAALFARLGDTAATFDWEGGGDNPYFAYLALADAVIVTGDSTAMCTEACATGRPVYIDAPPAHTAAKHKRLHDKLYALGHARPLDAALGPDGLADWRYPPLDDAAIIAREIIRRAGLPAPARIEETDTP
jgi:mitochondrial fission protein ELM1